MLLWLGVALAGAPQGTWERAEASEVVAARVEAAVDAAAATFGVFKGLARARLDKVARWCHRYTLDLAGEPVHYRCDDLDPVVTPRAQLGVTRTLDLPQGPVPTLVQWRDPQLTVRFGGEDGARTNTLTFDGDRMVLTVTVESARLSAPITWTIPYVRVP